MKPGAYARIFGSGPVGASASLALLGLAAWAAGRSPELAFGLPTGLRRAVAAAGLLVAVIVIAWSVRALPVGARGVSLSVSGPFYWVRHPLYAAFLSGLNPALAVALDHPVYLVWAVTLHPLWHWLIRPEEKLMVEVFGEDYVHYASRTGRFFPRFHRA